YLVGIITDGDLRRHMSANLLDLKVEEEMTAEPKTVRPDQLVSAALELLNWLKKTQLIVVDGGRPVGVVNFHDRRRAGGASWRPPGARWPQRTAVPTAIPSP